MHDDGGGTNTSEQVTFQIEITKPRKLHNSAESGPRNGLDVTGSTSVEPEGSITAGDALAVINYINAKGTGLVPVDSAFGPPYCDVTGDGEVAPDDVLKVINYINAANAREGEAESPILVADIQGSGLSEGDMLQQFATPSNQSGPSPDLLSLLAANVVAEQAKRRRVAF